MYLVAIVIIALAVLGAVALFAVSPGRIRPVTDSGGRPIDGSIAEKVRVTIDGTRQGMVIRSANPANPVLLFIHGGPGMPEYFLDATMPTGLEQDFTVVWWDQRGAGLSYRSGASAPESMTVEQLVSDTIAVTDYLRGRFDQPRIYLLAHSWGTNIGIRAVARAPERYHAYIGMGQVTHQIESERLAYDYALKRYGELGDSAMVHRLESAPVQRDAPLPSGWMAMRDDVMHRLGVGTTRSMSSVVAGIFVSSWLSRELTVSEKADLWRGKLASRRAFWDEFMMRDLRTDVPMLEVPAYFLHGRHDYTTSYALARDYCSRLNAPVKGFYTFENSAHSPVFEEPELQRRIMAVDVVTGRTSLADTD